MPILYETSPAEVKQLRRKYRPNALQVEEAPRWRVKEEWAINGIYLTVEQASKIIRGSLERACEKKGVILEYYAIEKAWAIWRVFWTEYHLIYVAIIRGSEASQFVIIAVTKLTVIAIIALAAVGIVIVFGIWLVATLIIEPILEVVPPELKPVLGAAIIALLFGGAILIGGLGYSYIKKKRK